MAAITDKLLSVGKRGTVTTLDAPGKPIGASSLKLTSAINWPTDSAVTFSIRRVHLSGENKGKEVAGSYTEWIGVLDPSSRSIDQLKLTYGEDQDYSTGQDVQVAIRVSTTWVELLLAGLRSFLNNDGTFKQGAVNAAAIADNAVEAKHIATKAVTADKIDFASVNKYSTEERVIGEWIDGRPVYQKTLDIIVDFKQNQYTNVPHGISGITDNLVVVSTQSASAISRTSGEVNRPIPRIEWQHQAGLISVEKSDLVFAASWPWGRSRVILTLQYVK